MLVGNAGVGKTVFVGDTLARLSEEYAVSRVPFNYYTTSAALQGECRSCARPETGAQGLPGPRGAAQRGASLSGLYTVCSGLS